MDNVCKFTKCVAHNTSKLVLNLVMDDGCERVKCLQCNTKHVNLSMTPEFQMELGMAMVFQGGDVDAYIEETRNEAKAFEEVSQK